MMLLSQYNAIPYLLRNDKRIITPKDILRDKYFAYYQDGISRNTTIIVNSNDSEKQRIFLKQPRYLEESNVDTLIIEAKIYFDFGNITEIKNLLPQFFFYDSTNVILGIEYLNHVYGFDSMFSIVLSSQIKNIESLKLINSGNEMTILAANTLKKLRDCKEFGRDFVEENIKKSWIFDKNFKPFVMKFTDRDKNKFLLDKDPIINILGQFLSREDVKKNINSIDWTPSHLIHGDVKFDNFIYLENEEQKLKIIDWEFATFGDYRWDAAGLIKEFWKKWETGTPFSALNKYGKDFTKTFLIHYLDTLKGKDFNKEAEIIIKLVGIHLLNYIFQNSHLFKGKRPILKTLLEEDVHTLLCDSLSVINNEVK